MPKIDTGDYMNQQEAIEEQNRQIQKTTKARCVRCHAELGEEDVFDKLTGTAFPECPVCGFTGYGENWWFEWMSSEGKPIRKGIMTST